MASQILGRNVRECIRSQLCEVAEGKDGESVIALECKDGCNLQELRGIVIASPGSPIEGYILFLDINIPVDYPFRPPKIKFKNKLWHPRINSGGFVSLDAIQSCWQPSITLESVLATLQVLLTDVGEDLHAMDHFFLNEARTQYLRSRELYNKSALKCTKEDNEGYGRLTFHDYRLQALRSFLHMEETKYKVYVFCQNSSPHSWTLFFVVTPNFYTFRHPAEQRYRHYMKLTTFHFRLDGADCITIDFGKGSTRDQCWKIMPASETTIHTDVIRKADPRQHQYEPSAFKLKLEWINLHSAPQRFLHKFHIVDSKYQQPPLHSFDVCLDPTSSSPSASLPDTKYYQRPSMVELIKFQPSRPRSTPFDLTQKIGSSFMKFGTLLLEDEDGNKMGSLCTQMVGRSCSDIGHEILRRWLGGEGKQPITWSTIVEVLNDVQLSQCAKEIKETKNC